LRTEFKIPSAIQELPRTLDAFYDRILMGLKEDGVHREAYRALQWLIFVARPVSLEELAETLIIQPDQGPPYMNSEDRLMSCKELLEILPSGLIAAVQVKLQVKRGGDDYVANLSDSFEKTEKPITK
jgi:hypothetical protein